jgi:LysR family transcriptional regulator, glycine cleavage system transcriptional activator
MSFIRAADELAVTQSAVSHQIQKLEQHLGVPLFIRRTRSIDLTPEGQRYYKKIRQALEWIAEGTRDVRGARNPRASLKVSLLSSFATHWLAPRMADFSAAHPDIHLQLSPTIELAKLEAGAADLAIRYGEGDWPHVESSLLMRERVFPVCSPDYLAARGPFNTASDLRAGPMLMSYAHRHFEWEAWSAQLNVDLSDIPKIMLHDYNIVLEAAIAGQGIAMGRQRLIEKRLATRELVEVISGAAYEGSIGYWLVTAKGTIDPTTERFADWIRRTGIKDERREPGPQTDERF